MPGKLKWFGGGGGFKRGGVLPWHGRVHCVICKILYFQHSSQRILWHKGSGSWQPYMVCGMGSGHKEHSWYDQGGLGFGIMVGIGASLAADDVACVNNNPHNPPRMNNRIHNPPRIDEKHPKAQGINTIHPHPLRIQK